MSGKIVLAIAACVLSCGVAHATLRKQIVNTGSKAVPRSGAVYTGTKNELASHGKQTAAALRSLGSKGTSQRDAMMKIDLKTIGEHLKAWQAKDQAEAGTTFEGHNAMVLSGHGGKNELVVTESGKLKVMEKEHARFANAPEGTLRSVRAKDAMQTNTALVVKNIHQIAEDLRSYGSTTNGYPIQAR